MLKVLLEKVNQIAKKKISIEFLLNITKKIIYQTALKAVLPYFCVKKRLRL